MIRYSELIQPDETDRPYIFVSYSRNDSEQVQSILQILRRRHIRFWYDMGIKSGAEWVEELGEKINGCSQFMLLLSANAMNSKYVTKEMSMADSKDKQILVVYLEEITLNNAFALLIGNIQAIHKNNYPNGKDFEVALCNGILDETIDHYNDNLRVRQISHDEAKNQLLDNYIIMEELGVGGLSRVFLASDKQKNTFAAVKCSGKYEPGEYGLAAKQVFEDEKVVLKGLAFQKCPCIPEVLDWYQDSEQTFLVETLVDGDTVRNLLPYSEYDVVLLAREVLAILKNIHASGYVHGDIKPSNIIKQAKTGNIYLVDFNAARKIGCRKTVVMDDDEVEFLIGTSGFAPPEQFTKGTVLDCTADLYALGRTMEYLLNPEDFYQMNENFPPRFFDSTISVEFEAVLLKMTALKKENRYQSADEVIHALENYKNIAALDKLHLSNLSRKRIKTAKEKYKNRIIMPQTRKINEHEEIVSIRFDSTTNLRLTPPVIF